MPEISSDLRPEGLSVDASPPDAGDARAPERDGRHAGALSDAGGGPLDGLDCAESVRVAAADEADWRACRASIRVGSRSFYAASLLLPGRLRDPAYALYAFCRLSDDAVDAASLSPEGRLAAVGRLRRRLDLVFEGRPMDAAADRALAETAARFRLPKGPLEALLEGFEWDAEGRAYETISGVRAYGARVAGAVGAMMAALMDARDPERAARACDLGVAMQLTNIARDVGEDARAGRLYLPRAWMREAGLDPEAFLAAPAHSPALALVVARLLDEADRLYARAEPGIAALPARCRPAIWAARYLYAGIGDEVRRNGLDAVSRRAVTTRSAKLSALTRALAASTTGRADSGAEALPEVRFLVDALAASSAAQDDVAPPPWWRLDERALRLVLMIDALNERDFAQRTADRG